MAVAGNREWLKRQLVRALGWDEIVAEGVVEAVAAAGSAEEVQSIVLDFMGGSQPARQLVAQFRGPAGSASSSAGGGPAPPPPMPGMRAYRKGDPSLQAGGPSSAPALRAVELPPPPAAAAAAAVPAAAAQGSSKPAAASAAGASAGGSSAAATALDMGVNVRTTVAKPRKGKGGSGAGAAGGKGGAACRLQRRVVNCLSCGKVYDCRGVSNDVIQFLESGGHCTFCGALVALHYVDGTTNEPEPGQQQPPAQPPLPASAAPGGAAAAAAAPTTGGAPPAAAAADLAGFKPEGEQANAAGAVAYNTSEAAARALKDRLVQYDRQAAKRTTVIDDQSDFFAIDTNQWLTDQERAALRQRQREVEEAEAARRRKVVVSIDLLGRRVVMAGQEAEPWVAGNGGGGGAGGGGGSGGGAGAAAAQGREAAVGEAAAQAAAATLGEAAQGGGAAAEAALARARQALEGLRIKVNPSMQSQFVFLPRQQLEQQQQQQRQGPARVVTPAAGSEQRGTGSAAGRRHGRDAAAAAAARASVGVPRLQHDDPFQGLADSYGDGIEVLADSEEARAALEAALDQAQGGPFDICLPSSSSSSSDGAGWPVAVGSGRDRQQERQQQQSRQQAPAPAAPRAEAVQEGLVLLRGWLSLEQQAEVVRLVRQLGLGPGGFYQPSYSSGGALNLHMMCLGRHWEPRTATYEPARSWHDGATPPPIPQQLAQLAARCLADAQAVEGAGRLPDMAPDVCLCNFYAPKQGRLGLHQDKDEGRESLRAGLPVVSLSLGDAADFVHGPSRDEACCSMLRLESGDALVFGGAARMAFHGVPRIHAGTAPPELLAATGLRPGRLNLTFRPRPEGLV